MAFLGRFPGLLICETLHFLALRLIYGKTHESFPFFTMSPTASSASGLRQEIDSCR